MLRLTYSNLIENLVAALCRDLEAERATSRTGYSRAQLFAGTPILVPNQQIAAYIKFALARERGIAANLNFQFMTSFIASCAPNEEIRVLDKPQLQTLLLSVLSDERLLADPTMAPVTAYLEAAGTDQDAVDLRRFQLAAQLATLLSDYRLDRPDMIKSWRDGPVLRDTRHADTEAWQRTLWMAIFDPERGLLANIERDRGTRWLLGPDLFNHVLVKDMDLPRRIYMFGFSYLPYAHYQVLTHLARFRDIHVYALNPCMEFWEDLRAGWESRLAGRALPSRQQAPAQLSLDDLDDLNDTPALRLWGRPGRENIRLLNEMSQCDFHECFADPRDLAPEPPSMLVALQSDILFRQSENAADSSASIAADDDSIQILACPSIQRELEIIGNEIWRLLRADDDLRFNDIAVLVSRSDRELYHAHLPAVFGELHQIPYHLAETSLRDSSRIVEALELLLELPFGRFTRPELLRLLTHPALLARYPDIDGNDWVHWSERLGIVHGADHADHAGTYIERDIYNWDQGIRRLALGTFMAAERSGDSQALYGGASDGTSHRAGDEASHGATGAATGEAYLPEEVAPDRTSSAARFALMARSLISDARYCQRAQKPLSAWRTFFDLMLSSYLSPTSPEDEHALAQCREAIATLSNRDLDGRDVGYRIACELLRQELGDLHGERGEYLAQGVTVAALLPMRPVPYRVLFLAGLGEGRFPAAERESPLDLRAARRRRSDVNPRERDRYVFLEALLSARQRLYVSHVARDEQTGDVRQPSPVALELAHILRRSYADKSAAARLAIQHPLRRYDARYFPQLFEDGQPLPAKPASAASANARRDRGADPNEGTDANTDTGAAAADTIAQALGSPPDISDDAQNAASPVAAEPANGRQAAPLISIAPAAHRQANALALRRHLEDTVRAQGMEMPRQDDLRRVLAKRPQFSRLRRRLGLSALDARAADTAIDSITGAIAGASGDETPVLTVSLAMVRRFLESPLQAWAAAILRLRESEMEDLIGREDEAFTTPRLPEVVMLRDVFAGHLGHTEHDFSALWQRYCERANRHEMSGQGPTGIFSQVERERHHEILKRWWQHLDTMLDKSAAPEPDPFVGYSFGSGTSVATTRAAANRALPVIALDIAVPSASSNGGRRPREAANASLVAGGTPQHDRRNRDRSAAHAQTVRVELFGQTEMIGPSGIGSIITSHRRDLAEKLYLRGLIDQLALSAAGVVADHPHVATVITAGDDAQQRHIEPWSQKHAIEHLGVLVGDMLGATHEYLLPCEAVFAWHANPADKNLAREVYTRKQSGRGMSCLYGPVRHIDDLDAPPMPDALVERRFGPFFTRMLGDQAPTSKAASPRPSGANSTSDAGAAPPTRGSAGRT